MNDFNLLRKQDLVENPTARVPICLCLDTSFSMGAIIDPENTRETGESCFKDGQEWILIRGSDGTEGYIQVKDGEILNIGLPAEEVFSDCRNMYNRCMGILYKPYGQHLRCEKGGQG